MPLANEVAFEVALRREYLFNPEMTNEKIERMGEQIYHLSHEQVVDIASKAAGWYAEHLARVKR